MINIKVSIIIPVYNAEEFLPRCLNSVLSQTFSDYECILVNDCSTDSSPNICNEYAKKDNRIKVIHNQKNIRSSLSRKVGFENSCGEYIQFVDSDDWIEPEMTEKLYNAAITHNADVVACDYYRNDDEGYKYENQIIDTENLRNNLGFVNGASVWNKFYNRNIIKLIDFPEGGRYEDRCITQQALFFAKRITKVQCPLYHYYVNKKSISHEINIASFYEWRNNIILTVDFLSKNMGTNFIHINKNIYLYINKYKFKILKNTRIKYKDKIKLTEFYPESNFILWIFTRSFEKAKQKLFPKGKK